MSVITIEKKALKKNDEIARGNEDILKEHGIFCFNLVSSPGSGKTSLLEKTLELNDNLNISVAIGDVQTDRDARRIARFDTPVVQLVTRGACHLDASQVRNSFEELPLQQTDVLIIENVGNLICPSGYKLGEDLKVVLLSTTEGDDKPLKYPAMFRNSSAMVINKTDLLSETDFVTDDVRDHAAKINPELEIFETSCKTGAGLDSWINWIKKNAQNKKSES